MSEGPPNPSLSPDTLEAYQEIRTAFSEAFETHATHIQEWHADEDSYCRGLTFLSKHEGFIIDLVHMPEYADLEFDGYIDLTIGNQSHQFGIFENGNLILYRHINYELHGLGLHEYPNISSDEEEEFCANIRFEQEMSPSLPTNIQTARELINLLRGATPTQL